MPAADQARYREATTLTITPTARIKLQRVADEHLSEQDRHSDLFEISIDEVAWRKGPRYLTLVGDHARGCVVWGCDGKGQAAAEEFFAELDPAPETVLLVSRGRTPRYRHQPRERGGDRRSEAAEVPVRSRTARDGVHS